jgi:AhpD family alkylhydroperoxidase
MTTPRITPLAVTDLDVDSLGILERLRSDVRESNVFLTLIRHPTLFRRFIAYGGAVINGSLPPSLRELAILRVAVRCGCDYEWGQHVREALAVGLPADKVAAVAQTIRAEEWEPLERAVLMTVDQLHDRADIDGQIWQELIDGLEESAVIELIMLVGHFHSVAYFLNALRVPVDPEIEALRIPSPPAPIVRDD